MDFIIDIMDDDISDGKHINFVNLIFYYIELFFSPTPDQPTSRRCGRNSSAFTTRKVNISAFC